MAKKKSIPEVSPEPKADVLPEMALRASPEVQGLAVPKFQSMHELAQWLRINRHAQIDEAEVESEKRRLVMLSRQERVK